jgi:hypothetical protein
MDLWFSSLKKFRWGVYANQATLFEQGDLRAQE